MVFRQNKIIDSLDKIALLSVYVVAFFFPISKAIIEIAATLAIVCYLLKKILQREGFQRTPFNIAVFIYLSVCFFSIFISVHQKVSIRIFTGKVLQEILFLFAVVGTLNNGRRMKNFIYILLSSSLVLGIDGIYQHFTHKDFIRSRPYYGLPRIHATFSTANDYGCYLAAMIPFALSCFLDKVNFKRLVRFLFAGLFVLLFICLMLTVSRGAWFYFVGSILFMSIWVRALGLFFLLLGVFVIVAQHFYYPIMKERLNNFFNFVDYTSVERMKIWDAAWKIFISRPIVGMGLGTFMFNFTKYVDKAYRFTAPYAHNCYLQIASELGIIGLVSFLSILVIFFAYGMWFISYKKNDFFWYMLLGTLASVLGYCMQMAVDTNFYSLDLGLMFWLLLGLGIAAMNNMEPKGQELSADTLNNKQ